MIGEVIAGVIQGSALWKTLRQIQRYNDAVRYAEVDARRIQKTGGNS